MQDAFALSRLLRLDGTLKVDFVQSEALAGNSLGDPATRPSAVYLPPGYDPAGSRRYAALYVLHGYTGDVAAMVSSNEKTAGGPADRIETHAARGARSR